MPARSVRMLIAAVAVAWLWCAYAGTAGAATHPVADTQEKGAGPATTSMHDTPKASSHKAGERTLDAITIEGEIAVPQVLFITSRDQPRYQDMLHRRYLRSSLDVGAQAFLPSHILMKESRP